MSDQHTRPRKSEDRKVFEVRTADGRRLRIEDTIEVGPPEAFEDCDEAQSVRERYGPVEILRNSAASLTYLLIILVGLKRVFGEDNELGYKIAMLLGTLLFLWAIAICWFGSAAIISNQNDEDRLAKMVRLLGIVGSIPMILVARSLW
ncbi:MAG TPA: hypothetical protein PLA92_08625 [Fimbriimonadaceae bacterium]|nr:hypothetical protein [Fimbriimonadaceae bacterium]